MNKQEKKAMVEQLKENVYPWFYLPFEGQKFLATNWEHVLVRHKTDWQKPWFPYRTLDDGCVVRLSPDFQLPAPAIEAPAGYRTVSMEDRNRCKFPVDCDIKYTVCGRHGWIPPLYRNWRNDETDGFSRHYAVPSNYTFAEDRPKQEPCFVEYPVFVSDIKTLGYRCVIKHCSSAEVPLHKLPSIVGFTGDILFRYSDGTEQWRYTLTDRSRDGTPATPIAARFYINGETK